MSDLNPGDVFAAMATGTPWWVWLALTLTSVIIAVTAYGRDEPPAARRRVIDPAVRS